MCPSETYLNGVIELLIEVRDSQLDNIDRAAEVIAQAFADNRMVHVWGPGGHSSMFAEDVLYRKGGLALFNPILDASISLSHGALKEINGLERVRGLGTAILKYHRVRSGDVMLMGSAYGVNPVAIEAALECKRLGVHLIAVTSPAFSDSVPKQFEGRHESDKSLYEVADIVIDSKVPPGDAIVDVPGAPQKVAPVASIMQLAVLQAIVACVVEKLAARGIEPPIWTNSLSRGGIEKNQRYIKEMYGKAKSL